LNNLAQEVSQVASPNTILSLDDFFEVFIQGSRPNMKTIIIKKV
jgi:hypothetical protein